MSVRRPPGLTRLRDAKFAVSAMQRIIQAAQKEGPDEFGVICLYTRNNKHSGIGIGWVTVVVALAEAQIAALQVLKDLSDQ